ASRSETIGCDLGPRPGSPTGAPLAASPPLFHRICSVFPSRRSRFSALGRRGPGREQGRESLDQRVVFMALVATSSLVAGAGGRPARRARQTAIGPRAAYAHDPAVQSVRLGNRGKG